MPDRLSPLDVSFLYLEEATTPMHVGGVAVFSPPDDGFDHARLVQLIRERIAFVPRYRQRLRWVPGHLANPVWVDDETFDVTYHVRRSALPRPGSDEQLRELVSRLISRRLDRSRPLWEVYLVEGLQGGRFALVTKTHHAMVDGIGAVDIAQVLLDSSPEPREAPRDTWRPAPEPTWVELVAGAVGDAVRRPAEVVETLQSGFADARTSAERLAEALGGVLAGAGAAPPPAPESPLNAAIGEARRYATAATELDDYKRIRKHHADGRPITVNDVVLAVATGALRNWLLARRAPVPPGATVRALVPVSVRGPADAGGLRRPQAGAAAGLRAEGNRIANYLVDLPVGEAHPVQRLRRVSRAMRAHKETGQAVGAEALVGLAGFAPPTLHAVGARVASGLSRRLFNVIVTNVPGPQFPLYAAGARMLAAYPVVPLAKGQAVGIGLTSYDGGVYYGLNADRDAMPDVEVLAAGLEESLAELLATVR